jgi:pimeloyl-ACP methyl ester carboxylesterase
LANSPTELRTDRFTAADGVSLAWHETGEGRPVVLIHGLFSDAWTNWIRYGHAAAIAARGFRVIMPDLRAHGDSDKPHEATAYPPDILADDGAALIAHLGLIDYDLGGYSLGGRTTVRMLVRGAAPRRAVIAGMGMAGLLDTGHRAVFFRRLLDGLGTHQRGSPEFMAAAFLKTTGGDPKALRPLLDSFVDTTRGEIAAIAPAALVLSGEDDHDNGSAAALAAALPHGEVATVPGNHMSAVMRPELGEAIADFLAG